MVEDDGVGREANKRVQQPMLLKKESMGMKITQDRLNIINSKNNSKASFKISDLILNKPSSGTRVELNLPLQA
ncbi:MAG: hypothetical protein IPO63_09795 [Bacteroidetes bacterium]|nr:hypothetical protein [Bacteroidota bacterium]